MNSSPSPSLDWAVRTLAKAFETDTFDILTERHFEYFLRCVSQGILGYATHDGIIVRYIPYAQTMKFESGTDSRAREIAESVSGARRGSFVVVLLPQDILDPPLREDSPWVSQPPLEQE